MDSVFASDSDNGQRGSHCLLGETKATNAATKGQMTETKANLHDDNKYLKDLTAQCEFKAKEWAGLNKRSTRNPLLHTSTFGPFSAVSTPIFASK